MNERYMHFKKGSLHMYDLGHGLNYALGTHLERNQEVKVICTFSSVQMVLWTRNWLGKPSILITSPLPLRAFFGLSPCQMCWFCKLKKRHFRHWGVNWSGNECCRGPRYFLRCHLLKNRRDFLALIFWLVQTHVGQLVSWSTSLWRPTRHFILLLVIAS